MKQRHKGAYKTDALFTLKNLKIEVGQDFHTLGSGQVDSLLQEADRVRYQKPKGANGSRARYFHDLLQRRAQMKSENNQ